MRFVHYGSQQMYLTCTPAVLARARRILFSVTSLCLSMQKLKNYWWEISATCYKYVLQW